MGLLSRGSVQSYFYLFEGLGINSQEDGTDKSVPGFAFVEANLDTPAEFGVFHPLQHG
jgi:hypothetical protein